jgi:hypothetical protein
MVSALFLCFLLGALLLVVFILRPRHLFGSRDDWHRRSTARSAGEAGERRKPGMDKGQALEERRKDDDVGGES